MDNSTYKIKTINEIRKNVTGFNRINNAIEYNLKLNLEKRKLRNLWTDSQHSKTRHLHEVLVT
jgi:regulator of replication initiation timing